MERYHTLYKQVLYIEGVRNVNSEMNLSLVVTILNLAKDIVGYE